MAGRGADEDWRKLAGSGRADAPHRRPEATVPGTEIATCGAPRGDAPSHGAAAARRMWLRLSALHALAFFARGQLAKPGAVRRAAWIKHALSHHPETAHDKTRVRNFLKPRATRQAAWRHAPARGPIAACRRTATGYRRVSPQACAPDQWDRRQSPASLAHVFGAGLPAPPRLHRAAYSMQQRIAIATPVAGTRTAHARAACASFAICSQRARLSWGREGSVERARSLERAAI